MNRLRAALVLAGLLLLVVGPPAQAHTGLVSITPADGARVAAAPRAVTLTFDEPVDPDGTTVVVTGPDGAVVSTGPTSVRGATVQQPLGALAAAGRYTVSYRITSGDGHPVTASKGFALTAGAAAGPAAAAAPVEAPAAAGGSQVVVVVLALVALAVVGAIGAAGLRRRVPA